jgi:g-D-glutamyl-meso-diaminopimelate peptidase
MRTVGLGDTGSIVELLQWGLANTDTSIDAPDGIFGQKTEEAVRRFQESAKLTPDGVAGPKTWAVLYPYLTGFTVHPVLEGDTLSTIAARYQMTPEKVISANPGIVPKALAIGALVRVPLPFPTVPTTIRWSHDLLALVVEGLRTRYPFLRVETIGLSVLGRPLYQISIGKGSVRVGYNAAHHGNEWITTPLLLKFLENYCEGYAGKKTIGGVSFEHLYETYTLDMVPMVNPDGVDLVTGAMAETSPHFLKAKKIAEEFPNLDFPNAWKANIEGVDVNLCYPAGWEEAKRVKYAAGYNRPAPRDFVGYAPLDAPEARAMYRHTRKEDYHLTLSYHSQGKLIYWKYKNYNPAGAYNLALRMQGVSGYLPDDTPTYSANAGYKDWFIQDYKRPGYTIEVGSGTSPLPLSQFDGIYQDNYGILLLGMIGLEINGGHVG